MRIDTDKVESRVISTILAHPQDYLVCRAAEALLLVSSSESPNTESDFLFLKREYIARSGVRQAVHLLCSQVEAYPFEDHSGEYKCVERILQMFVDYEKRT